MEVVCRALSLQQTYITATSSNEDLFRTIAHLSDTFPTNIFNTTQLCQDATLSLSLQEQCHLFNPLWVCSSWKIGKSAYRLMLWRNVGRIKMDKNRWSFARIAFHKWVFAFNCKTYQSFHNGIQDWAPVSLNYTKNISQGWRNKLLHYPIQRLFWVLNNSRLKLL